MDDRLKKALDFSNYRTSLFNKKQDIKAKFESMLLHGCNGGVFTISRELICFVDVLLKQKLPAAVLIDNNGNPIDVQDLAAFNEDLLTKYFEATNYYNSEYTKLKQARSVNKLLDIIGD